MGLSSPAEGRDFFLWKGQSVDGWVDPPEGSCKGSVSIFFSGVGGWVGFPGVTWKQQRCFLFKGRKTKAHRMHVTIGREVLMGDVQCETDCWRHTTLGLVGLLLDLKQIANGAKLNSGLLEKVASLGPQTLPQTCFWASQISLSQWPPRTSLRRK